MKICLQLTISAILGLFSCGLSAQSLLSNVHVVDEIVNNVEAEWQQISSTTSISAPLVIADLIGVNYTHANTGTWSSFPDGSKKWVFNYNLEGAEAIGIYFATLKIPEGASLRIESDIDGIILDEFNNENDGGYATRKIYGDQLIFTYEINPGYIGKLYLHINKIARYVEGEYGFNSSDACMVNVNCSEGNLYRKEQRSVVRIDVPTVDGLISFTGTLVNNSSENCKPYILTSNYDFLKEENADLESFVFYFNYEVTDCNDEADEPKLQSMVGCQYVASSSDLEDGNSLKSDFCLLELNESIPEEFNAYFAGWSINNVVSNEGVVIHHPVGDVKKISTYTDALQSVSYAEFDPETLNEGDFHWKLKFSNTANGLGMVQPGSAGAPLFDNDGYLIGTLSGSEANCFLIDESVYFGKMAQHWSSNGSQDNRQLKTWLDPENLGIDKLEGREANCLFGVGVTETNNYAFEIIPNPASDQIKINVADASKDVSITIYNYLGQSIYNSSNTAQESYFVNMSKYQSGVYFVHLTIQGKTSVQKLILSH